MKVFGVMVVAVVIGAPALIWLLRSTPPAVVPLERVDWTEVEALADMRRSEQVKADAFLTATREPVIEAPSVDASAAAFVRLDELLEENARLRLELHALRVSDALNRAEGSTGPIGEWARTANVDVLPSLDTMLLASEYLADYPVRLAYHEGLWLFARMERDDWLDWGPTVDEALILYLGPQRIAAEVEPEHLAKLAAEWEAEGYFRGLTSQSHASR